MSIEPSIAALIVGIILGLYFGKILFSPVSKTDLPLFIRYMKRTKARRRKR